MSEERRSPDPSDTPTVAADLLSEATDLDSLLTAILGDKPDSVSTLRSALDAVAATEDVPPAAECEAASQPPVTELPNVAPLTDSLVEFPCETQRETVAVSDTARSDDDADLAALRARLQLRRDTVPPRHRSSDAPELAANRRGTIDDTRSVQPAGPNLQIIDEQLSGLCDSRGVIQQSSGEPQDVADDTHYAVGSPASDAEVAKARRPGRVPLILVGVGVAVIGALITLNAIPRAGKAGEQPSASAGSFTETALPPSSATSPGRQVVPDAAPVTNPATSSASTAASTFDQRRNMRTTPPSSSDVRGPSVTPTSSAAPPGRTVDAASNEVSPAATRSDMPPLPEVPPAQSEPEPRRDDTSVTSAPLPAVAESAAGAVAGDPPAPRRASENPRPEPPAATTSSAATPVSRTPPRLIKSSTPEYPNVLRAARIGGVVEVQLTIDETGRVTHAAAVSGPALLREPAERAVRTWRYEPATENGVQTSAKTTVSFNFDRK